MRHAPPPPSAELRTWGTRMRFQADLRGRTFSSFCNTFRRHFLLLLLLLLLLLWGSTSLFLPHRPPRRKNRQNRRSKRGSKRRSKTLASIRSGPGACSIPVVCHVRSSAKGGGEMCRREPVTYTAQTSPPPFGRGRGEGPREVTESVKESQSWRTSPGATARRATPHRAWSRCRYANGPAPSRARGGRSGKREARMARDSG